MEGRDGEGPAARFTLRVRVRSPARRFGAECCVRGSPGSGGGRWRGPEGDLGLAVGGGDGGGGLAVVGFSPLRAGKGGTRSAPNSSAA